MQSGNVGPMRWRKQSVMKCATKYGESKLCKPTMLLMSADVMAAPHGRILFSGEATSTKMATALGALLSGRREAERILNMTATTGAANQSVPEMPAAQQQG